MKLPFSFSPPQPDFVETRPEAVMRVTRRVIGASSGHNVLECVRLPDGLLYSPSKRARRLMRTARISNW